MRTASVMAGEHRPVGLHQGENVGRANAKQQDTVNGLEGAHHPIDEKRFGSRWSCPRYACEMELRLRRNRILAKECAPFSTNRPRTDRRRNDLCAGGLRKSHPLRFLNA